VTGVRGYREDLAYVHDAGFRDYALHAAPAVLRILRRQGVNEGLIVDLGCGSGRWAAELNRSGYDVLGIDQSPAMIQLARRIAPASHFRIASLWNARLPPCAGITSIGECLNYCFDRSGNTLGRLFQRVYRALRPGGVFVFDIAGPDRLPKQLPSKNWIEGRDWAILVSVSGNRRQHILHRQIICYRNTGSLFRRSEETHALRLYRTRDLLGDLAQCGFQARETKSFPTGISGIIALKP